MNQAGWFQPRRRGGVDGGEEWRPRTPGIRKPLSATWWGSSTSPQMKGLLCNCRKEKSDGGEKAIGKGDLSLTKVAGENKEFGGRGGRLHRKKGHARWWVGFESQM